MLISELIKELQNKKNQYGDIEVVTSDMDYLLHNPPHLTVAQMGKIHNNKTLLIIE